ncbi:hypothetical protein BGX38DRAFT_1258664 [Terfezia claveryi]|nr:hypothetical protein BGX38DRAFT_1258664 [Terfezia claveryi]
MPGTYTVPVYNDESEALVIRSRDNTAQATKGRKLQPKEKSSLQLPKDDPYIVVVRTGKRDAITKWDKTDDFHPGRDAPAPEE